MLESLDGFLDCLILLVTEDEFNSASATGLEKGKVSQDVENAGRVENHDDEHLAVVEWSREFITLICNLANNINYFLINLLCMHKSCQSRAIFFFFEMYAIFLTYHIK